MLLLHTCKYYKNLTWRAQRAANATLLQLLPNSGQVIDAVIADVCQELSFQSHHGHHNTIWNFAINCTESWPAWEADSPFHREKIASWVVHLFIFSCLNKHLEVFVKYLRFNSGQMVISYSFIKGFLFARKGFFRSTFRHVSKVICILLGCDSHFIFAFLRYYIWLYFAFPPAASVCFGGTLPGQYDWAFGHRRAADVCLPGHVEIAGHLLNVPSAAVCESESESARSWMLGAI